MNCKQVLFLPNKIYFTEKTSPDDLNIKLSSHRENFHDKTAKNEEKKNELFFYRYSELKTSPVFTKEKYFTK